MYTYLFKEFHNVFSYSYKETLDIDPHIVKQEIIMCEHANPV
jgi:hypothetical protein